jgi:hypothetical protein
MSNLPPISPTRTGWINDHPSDLSHLSPPPLRVPSATQKPIPSNTFSAILTDGHQNSDHPHHPPGTPRGRLPSLLRIKPFNPKHTESSIPTARGVRKGSVIKLLNRHENNQSTPPISNSVPHQPALRTATSLHSLKVPAKEYQAFKPLSKKQEIPIPPVGVGVASTLHDRSLKYTRSENNLSGANRAAAVGVKTVQTPGQTMQGSQNLQQMTISSPLKDGFGSSVMLEGKIVLLESKVDKMISAIEKLTQTVEQLSSKISYQPQPSPISAAPPTAAPATTTPVASAPTAYKPTASMPTATTPTAATPTAATPVAATPTTASSNSTSRPNTRGSNMSSYSPSNKWTSYGPGIGSLRRTSNVPRRPSAFVAMSGRKPSIAPSVPSQPTTPTARTFSVSLFDPLTPGGHSKHPENADTIQEEDSDQSGGSQGSPASPSKLEIAEMERRFLARPRQLSRWDTETEEEETEDSASEYSDIDDNAPRQDNNSLEYNTKANSSTLKFNTGHAKRPSIVNRRAKAPKPAPLEIPPLNPNPQSADTTPTTATAPGISPSIGPLQSSSATSTITNPTSNTSGGTATSELNWNWGWPLGHGKEGRVPSWQPRPISGTAPHAASSANALLHSAAQSGAYLPPANLPLPPTPTSPCTPAGLKRRPTMHAASARSLLANLPPSPPSAIDEEYASSSFPQYHYEPHFETHHEPDPRPGWFFFYGALRDPSLIQELLGLPQAPVLSPARVWGHKTRYYGVYPAAVQGGTGECVRGTAWYVSRVEQAAWLRKHEEEWYAEVTAQIEFEDGRGETVAGRMFVWRDGGREGEGRGLTDGPVV